MEKSALNKDILPFSSDESSAFLMYNVLWNENYVIFLLNLVFYKKILFCWDFHFTKSLKLKQQKFASYQIL